MIAPTVGPAAVRILVDAEPTTLQPLFDSDRWGQRIAFDNLYEPLWRVADDGSVEPLLAEGFVVEDEGRALLVRLRPGVRFQDGQPLTARDVEFSFERAKSPLTPAPWLRARLAEVWRIEVLSPTRVRFLSTRIAGYLIGAIAAVPILPEHVFGRGPITQQPGNRHPVGTGPYRLQDWRKAAAIVLERSPSYWGRPAAAPRIEFLVEPDGARALTRLKRGEADVLPDLPPSYVSELDESPVLKRTMRVERALGARVLFLRWNVERAPLDDARVRRALGLLCDRTRMLREARFGAGVVDPALGWPPGRFDPARAEALLDEAGYLRRGPQAVRQRQERLLRVPLLVPAGSSEAERVAQIFVEEAAKIGVAVERESADLASLESRLRRGAFEAALLEWAGTSDDEDLSSLFHSRQSAGGGAPVVDAALEALRRAPDAPTRRPLYDPLARALDETQLATLLYRPATVRLVARDVVPTAALFDFIRLRGIARETR